jgi:biopolymer transport protein ExbD
MINLTSMIDCIFLLLAYFMVTTTLAVPEARLASNLRMVEGGRGGASADMQSQVVEAVVIDGRPAYRVGSRVLPSRDELAGVLRGLDRSAGLFVEVSNDVSVAFAVAAMQVARDLGFQPVTYVPAK